MSLAIMSSLGSASDPSVIVAPADSLGAEGGEDRPLREAGKEKRFSLEKRFSNSFLLFLFVLLAN